MLRSAFDADSDKDRIDRVMVWGGALMPESERMQADRCGVE